MSVYVAAYREKDQDRLRQLDRIARQYRAGFITIESREDLVNNMVALGAGTHIGNAHRWVPLELTAKAVPLSTFQHPENVVYVVGAQNGTIPADVLDLMADQPPVYVETDPVGPSPVLPTPFVAGIVLHHRLTTSKFGRVAA